MTGSTEKRKNKAHGPTVNALKRAKFEAKQERLRQASLEKQQQSDDAQLWRSWFNEDREEYAEFITKKDVIRIKQLKHKQHQSTDSNACKAEDERLLRIASWIEPFFDLKRSDAKSAAQCNEEDRIFISEGTEAVRVMIQRCDSCPLDSEIKSTKSEDIEVEDTKDESESPPPVRIRSILCKPNTFFEAPVRLIDDVEKRISNNSQSPFKVIIGSEDALSEIAGFNIARGALACGEVPTYFQYNGYEWLQNKIRRRPVTLLALDAVSDTANLGSIIRTAAALSIDAVILSDDSCDAFYRQSVRVSMGHVINVPILRVSDWRRGFSEDDGMLQSKPGGLAEFINWLRVQMNVHCLAAVVDDESDVKKDSEPELIALESLSHHTRKQSWCCVLGNEGNGIRNEVIKECNQRIKISMANGIDSLSLPVAAAILMHGLGQTMTHANNIASLFE